MNDAELRAHIYDSFITTGRAPRLGDEHRDALQRLADAHVIVIDDDKNIIYAPPWSASPTPFIVNSNGVQSFGVCIWDALGILAMTTSDGTVDTSCGCCGDPMTLHVEDGELREAGWGAGASPARAGGGAGAPLAHFLVPAKKFWDDIVFT